MANHVKWTVNTTALREALVVIQEDVGNICYTRDSGMYFMAAAPGTGATVWDAAVLALTDGATISTNAAIANVFTVTLAGNRTLANPTNLRIGKTYHWKVTQDGTGNRTLAYGTYFLFAANTHVLSTGAAEVDLIVGTWDGTSLLCRLEKDLG